MKRVLLTGGSGFIGCSLKNFLCKKGYEVLSLVRHRPQHENEFFWDIQNKTCELPQTIHIDTIINLSGETINGLWTQRKKRKILESRVESSRYLTELFSTVYSPPLNYLQASAIGYYGNQGDELLDEESCPMNTFLSKVCVEWENSINPQLLRQTRCLLLRFGIILHPKGGILAKMLPAYKLGLGCVLGSGRQYISWITLEDLLEAIFFVMRERAIEGAVNMVAESIRQQDFSRALAKSLHRPHFLKIPNTLIKVGAGESAALFLDSQRVIPEKLINYHFRFQYPTISSAFNHYFSK